jgi:hypothetical protein
MRYPDKVHECVARSNMFCVGIAVERVANAQIAVVRELVLRAIPDESSHCMAAPQQQRDELPPDIASTSRNEHVAGPATHPY